MRRPLLPAPSCCWFSAAAPVPRIPYPRFPCRPWSLPTCRRVSSPTCHPPASRCPPCRACLCCRSLRRRAWCFRCHLCRACRSPSRQALRRRWFSRPSPASARRHHYPAPPYQHRQPRPHLAPARIPLHRRAALMPVLGARPDRVSRPCRSAQSQRQVPRARRTRRSEAARHGFLAGCCLRWFSVSRCSRSRSSFFCRSPQGLPGCRSFGAGFGAMLSGGCPTGDRPDSPLPPEGPAAG